jgi:hypothetical protein
MIFRDCHESRWKISVNAIGKRREISHKQRA